MEKVKELLQREPVRVYLYAVLEAIAALLVGIGVTSSSVALLGLGVAAAVLAVPATEKLRSKVSPVKKE